LVDTGGDVIRLSVGDTTVVVAPDLGSSVQRFRVGPVDVLRAGRPDLRNPLEMSSFPLVPWCNRIVDGRFQWDGRLVDVGGTPLLGEPHGLHGHGWLWRWDVVDESHDTVLLEYLHPAGRWPWRYRAQHRLAVEQGRLSQTLSVENLSDTAMPLALGFHPYFERPGRLTANIDGVWTGDDVIPERWEEREPFRATDVDRTEFDNTFTHWDGRALIEVPGGRVELWADLPLLHVFTPRGRGFFCVEPAEAVPAALNFGSRGGRVLEPGHTGSGSMRISFT
jgi:aldose 1-epimerase